MTTTKQETPAPVLGEIIVKVHDGARCVAWTLGGVAVTRGLTLDGIASAAKATAEFLGGLSAAERRAVDKSAGPVQVRIGVAEWSVPLVPGRAADIEALMTSVVNTDGAIGPVS